MSQCGRPRKLPVLQADAGGTDHHSKRHEIPPEGIMQGPLGCSPRAPNMPERFGVNELLPEVPKMLAAWAGVQILGQSHADAA